VNAPAESPLPPSLPTDLAATHVMILAERQARIEARQQRFRGSRCTFERRGQADAGPIAAHVEIADRGEHSG